jgi:prephenate dehydrogenase
MARVQSHLTGNVCTFAQHGALAATGTDPSHFERWRYALQKKRDITLEILRDLPCPVPNGAFYVFPDVTRFLNKGESTEALATQILERTNVAVAPGEAFGGEGHIRICYAVEEERLIRGLERLAKVFRERKGAPHRMIGIIGFGRFGRLMTGYLAQDFSVIVFNRSDKSDEIVGLGAEPADLKEVCRQKVVILSVPISLMRETLKRIAPLLQPDAMVVDVCSVKVYPIDWMKEFLPPSVSLLGTHPMFGPDSAAESLRNRKIVLCRVRIHGEHYQEVKKYLIGKGLNVIEATPEEHDRQIAVSLALTHFIGRGLDEFGAEELPLTRRGINGCCIFWGW